MIRSGDQHSIDSPFWCHATLHAIAWCVTLMYQQWVTNQAECSAQQWRMLLAESEAAKRHAMTCGHAHFQLAALTGDAATVRLSAEQLEALMLPTLQRMWPSLQELGDEACLEWHQVS